MIEQAKQAARRGLAGLVLGGALLVLVVALWQGARAAPQTSNGTTLDIVGVSGASVTLDGHNWQSATEVTLGYSTHSDCTPATGLPDSALPTDPGGNFHTTYTLPNTVPAGTYYMCATGLGTDGKSTTIPSPQQMIVDSSGMVTLPIGSATPTPTNTVPVPTSTPAPTNTTAPGTSATATTQAGGPGNQGASTTPPKSNESILVALVLVWGPFPRNDAIS